MSPPAFSVVLTNWNGMDLLPDVLPNVVEACRATGAAHEIVVVDDRSADGSPDWIRAHHPEVRLVEPPRNLGFQGASNLGFAAARYGVVLSLNNDILLDAASLPGIFRHFEDPAVFAVSTRVLLWDRTTYLAGRRRGVWARGHLRLADEDAPALSPTLFATGGAAAFRRDAVLRLGGFDPLYHPLYWEDVDLCWRAWKRGMRVLYDPGVLLFHKHRATIEKQYGGDAIRGVTARNAYLFLWKNLTDPAMRREAALLGPALALADLARGRPRFAAALAAAAARLPRALAANRAERREAVRGDAEILAEIAAG